MVRRRIGRRGRSAVALALLSLPAIALAGQTDSLQPAGWDDDIRLAEAVDLNADPRIVEVELDARVATVTIAPGVDVDAWTYNGTIPGPLIRAQVGDRVIVHYTNNLPRPSTVHWHGLRVPIEMDGVPGYSQPPVEVGDSFTYDFIVPDAGTFWYHPHVMSAAQVGFGLYGAFVVEDPEENLGIADELVIVLSDIDRDDSGTLRSPDTGGALGMVFGREGNHVLVNGRQRPALTARGGAPQRWRVVNAAKSRYFMLDLGPGHVFRKIGGDGGLTEYSEDHDFLVLGAGERADVLVTPTAEPGTSLMLRSALHDRGFGSTEYRDVEDLIDITIADMPLHPSGPLPTTSREITPYPTEGATAVDVTLTLSQDPRDRSFEYRINGEPGWTTTPVLADLGEVQLWTVENTTKWSHPLHLHGFFFLVLDEHDEPVRPLEWKDTVDIPFERTRRLLVRFDERPGTWIFHCHILDHAEGGMLSAVQLGLPASDFTPLAVH